MFFSFLICITFYFVSFVSVCLSFCLGLVSLFFGARLRDGFHVVQQCVFISCECLLFLIYSCFPQKMCLIFLAI